MGDVLVAETKEEAARKAKQMPEPTGYHILCMVPKIDSLHKGGVIEKAEVTKFMEEHTTVVLFVVKLGPEAYKDKNKFPNGPWCAQGNFVITRSYAGTRINIHGQEFRIINDDSVEAVIEDPRGVRFGGKSL